MEQIIDLSTYDSEKRSKILHMLAQKNIEFALDKSGKLVSPPLQLESIEQSEPSQSQQKEMSVSSFNKFKLSPHTSLGNNFLLNYPNLKPSKPKERPKPTKNKYDWLEKIAKEKEFQKKTKIKEQEIAQINEEKRLHKLEQQALNGLEYDKLNSKFEAVKYRQPIDNSLTFKNFITLFQTIDVGAEIRPKLISINTFIKQIELIYTSKYEAMKASVKGSSVDLDDENQTFSLFVFEYIKKKCKYPEKEKAKYQVVQYCNDVLFSIGNYSSKYGEIETFSKFLCDIYNGKELIFYLFIREKVEEAMKIKFDSLNKYKKTLFVSVNGQYIHPLLHSQTQSSDIDTRHVYMTLKTCIIAAKAFFTENISTLNSLQSKIENILITVPGYKEKQVEYTKFMHIAIQEYNNCLPSQDEEETKQVQEEDDKPSLAARVAKSDNSIAEVKISIMQVMVEQIVKAICESREMSGEAIAALTETLNQEIAKILEAIQTSNVERWMAALKCKDTQASSESVAKLCEEFKLLLSNSDDEDSITKFTNLLLENEDITAFIDNLMQE